MVDGQSTDKLKVGNFSEQVWGDLRERDQGPGQTALGPLAVNAELHVAEHRFVIGESKQVLPADLGGDIGP